MDKIRESSATDYATWYLNRDREKHPTAPDPALSTDPIALMKERHGSGKWLDWFDSVPWSIVTLDEREFRRLIFLDSRWTQEEGLTRPVVTNHRLLENVAQQAMGNGYMNRADQRHRAYYDQFLEGFRMTGERRVMIRSAFASEAAANPGGEFYLMDGAGRGLPYMILILQGQLSYEPVEAFLAIDTIV